MKNPASPNLKSRIENRKSRIPALLLALALALPATPVFAVEGPEPEGHPLVVLNGTGDGTYQGGEEVSISATTPGGYQFLMWIKTEGLGSYIADFSPNTTLTMGSKTTTIVAVFAKIEAWFPPGPESNYKGVLLPKDPAAQPSRFEHKVRITINRGEEGSDEVTSEKVWGYLSVQLGWFPTEECTGIWHSSELLTYWTQQQGGQAIGKDQLVDKNLFAPSGDVYQTSVWYAGNWTLAQLATKLGGDGQPLLPKAEAGFKLHVNWKDFSQVKATTSGTLLPLEIKQLNYPTATDTTDSGSTAQKSIRQDGGGIAYITGAPQMPQLEASIGDGSLSGMSVDWRMEIKTERSERDTKDDKNYPTSGYKTLPINQAWDIGAEFGSDFVGGKCKLFYKIDNIPEQNIEFKIRGKNPKDADAKSHIQGTQGTYQHAWAMVQHESRQGQRVYNQFNSDGATKELPNFSGNYPAEDGWGMAQLDMSLGVSASTLEVYNWHQNISKFYAELAEKKNFATWHFNALRNVYQPQGKWEEPPANFVRQGTSTGMTAMEAAIIQLYNGAAWLVEISNGQILYDGPYTNTGHGGTRYISCWKFHPDNPSGQKWEFKPNQNNYVYKVIYDEFEAHQTTQE